MRVPISLLLAMLLLGLQTITSAEPRPSDPYLSQQWALSLIKAPEVWNSSTGRGIVVAILDTGVDMNHPDLRTGILPGHDFIDHDADPRDWSGHGTHVAGIIGARQNAIGVVGVAPDALMLPVRVCTARDCPARAVAAGIRYAVNHDADVINLSIGANVLTGEAVGWNETVRRAAMSAQEDGVIVVAAAGNASLPICAEPAASAVCVGAVNSEKRKTLYSSHDAGLAKYLVAPGGDDVVSCEAIILSTYPRFLDSVCSSRGYEAMNGTSMAAPHVSGVVALLLGADIPARKVMHRLVSSASDLGPPGRDPLYGFGLVDASAALGG